MPDLNDARHRPDSSRCASRPAALKRRVRRHVRPRRRSSCSCRPATTSSPAAPPSMTFLPAAGRTVCPAAAQGARQGRRQEPRRRPVVLFLCVHNAGRSQMALGWFNHLAGDRAVAWSGGSEPGTEVNPSAVAAMAEVGIDITGEYPEAVDRRDRPSRRRRRHDGMRRRVPVLSRQALRRLGARRPRRPRRRRRAAHPRRDRTACPRPPREPRRARAAVTTGAVLADDT